MADVWIVKTARARGHGPAGSRWRRRAPACAPERDLRPTRKRSGRGLALFVRPHRWCEESMNNVKTMVLMAGLMGLFLLAGQLLGGSQGLVLALVLGGAFNFIMYFFSDRMVLRMYGAHAVTEAEAPELYR